MCRLLAVRDDRPFTIEDQLRPFAAIARASREYQGHGWGCAWQDAPGAPWRVYRNICPIWEDDVARFGTARVLVAHARSAFRDEGIAVEFNMPFLAGDAAFVFNGELRGVRIRETGRIGAEKLFNFMLAMDGRGDVRAEAGLSEDKHARAEVGVRAGPRTDDHDGEDRRRHLRRVVEAVKRRTRYVRAMNFVVARGGGFELCSFFNEDTDYFTMHVKREDGRLAICSRPFDGEAGWVPVANDTVEVFA